MSVFVFPGQGSQYKGMGKLLFSQFPDMVERANTILGYDIRKMVECDDIHQTAITQPLIYCISCLSWLVLKEQYSAEVVLGHSLGEYAALFAAEVFDFEIGLEIVKKRGALMQSAQSGGMVAVIGISADRVAQLIAEHHLPLHIANYNSPQQTVISGDNKAINESRRYFDEAKWIPLPVSGAFHSPLMEAVRESFKKVLATYSFRPAKLPIILNATARGHVDCVSSWPDNLSTQLVKPVYWQQSIEYCLSLGLVDFVEAEPSQLLTGLIDKIVNYIA